MFCCNCGSKLPENAKYCDNCGDLVKVDGNADKIGMKASDGNNAVPEKPVSGQTLTERTQPSKEIPQAPIGPSEEDARKKPTVEVEKPHESVAFAFGQAIGAGKMPFPRQLGRLRTRLRKQPAMLAVKMKAPPGVMYRLLLLAVLPR